jgi:N4-gp56 family major capsid protein
MADTSVPTALQVEQWDDRFFVEYLHDGGFKPLMGTNENAVIQVKEQPGKGNGDKITIQLVNKLTNAATTGVSTLEGNEEDMSQRSFSVTVNKRRNAVRIPEMSEVQSAIDLREAGRAVLLDWAMEDTRDMVIEALGSLNGIPFLSRTAVIADAWLVDNKDRTVFGAYASGGSAGGTDLSADLGQLDTTADKFTYQRLDDMIIRAKQCNPKIRPMRDSGNNRRYYVAFANPEAFRDLRESIDDNILANTAIQAEGAKLFEGGDLLWNGCIVKEVDDMPIYPNLGAGGTTEVTPVYLCGAQALCAAYAARWRSKTEVFDYGDKYGVAIDGIYNIEKVLFGSGASDTDDLKDHGVVTGFFATTGAATVTSAAEL